jgi:alkylation response protein AidB-like acyl-CoA dehydrogenase
MYIGFTPEQDALRRELRTYYDGLLTPEIRKEIQANEGGGPAAGQVLKKMAADGWLGIGWPVEYGGQGRTPIEQFIFFDESMRAGAPVPMLTVNSVAPTIMQFGTQEQKDFFLPQILAGEITFCIGYTEPESGTDLGSLKTRAVRDGDEYVINGQKIFTSLASTADYVWLAVRTDPETTNHKGISIVIVPTDTPGFKVTPIENMGQMDTTVTFYEDVRIPVTNLVGEEHRGWQLITNQLNHERVTLCSSGIIERQLEDVVIWAKTTTLADGRAVIEQPWVQLSIARVHANLEFLRLINFEVAWSAEQGQPLDPAAASSVKVFGTEFYLEALRLLQEVVGASASVRADQAGTVLGDRLGSMLRSLHILTFGGGTNELQRDLIALFGLNMPPSPR